MVKYKSRLKEIRLDAGLTMDQVVEAKKIDIDVIRKSTFFCCLCRGSCRQI